LKEEEGCEKSRGKEKKLSRTFLAFLLSYAVHRIGIQPLTSPKLFQKI
jgi:hypothetical protein